MIRNLFKYVFPDDIYCICCGSIIDSTRPYSLCNSCMDNIHWITGRTCSICGRALYDTYPSDVCYSCMDSEHVFDRGFSCVDYGLLERGIIMDFKYGGKSYIGWKLAEIMTDRFMCEYMDADIIVPVPVSIRRRNERGYNQAEILAKGLAAGTGIRYGGDVLKRVRDTSAMKALSVTDRKSNLKDAFKVSESAVKTIDGADIVLVDDIYTTGATADECCRVLKEAGAGRCYIFSFASAPNRRTEYD